MKQYFLAAAVGLGVLAGCSSSPKPEVEPAAAAPAKAQKDTLITPSERYSYALGMNLGQTLKDVLELEGVIDYDIMKQGMVSVIDTNQKQLMTPEEEQASLNALVNEVQASREAKLKAEAEAALAAEKAFLEKNKKEEGVVTTASGLQFKVIQNADGITPKKEDKVKVHYAGSLLNGEEFDSSYKRGEPLEFPVGAVIDGWQELLMNMKVGMKVKAWIPSALAYGPEGAPPVIPGNSLLIFDVELIAVEAANPPADTLTTLDSTAAAELADTAKAAAVDSAKAAEPAKAEAKPEAKAEVKEEAKAETKPEAKAETKAAEPAKEAAKTETKAEAKTEAKAETKTEAKAETKAAEPAKAEAKPEAKK